MGKQNYATALFVAFACVAAHAAEITGPLVGHTTDSTVNLWVHGPQGAQFTAVCSTARGDGDVVRAAFKPIDMIAKGTGGQAAKVTVKGLLPNTAYHFWLERNGNALAETKGVFKTAPKVGTPTQFRVGVTSCMRIDKPQESWELFLDQMPDIHITLGDTHYADTTDPSKQWKHHLKYRALPRFSQVLRSVSNYAMYDDHDYGPNDSDGTAKGKEHSVVSWDQVWANPPAGTAQTKGAFFKFSRGDVDFFIVDGRYHRSPDKAPDDDKKRMLGDTQFKWLLDGLKASKAKFKVIASGSTLEHSKRDGWKIYTFSRHRLFDAIRENKIAGVLYCSGDIHRSYVWEHHESDRVGYPFVEVISSGIANSKDLSFCTVDFDTTKADPTVHARVVLGNGRVRYEKTWALSTLSHK